MDLSVYRRFHDEAHNWILKSASCSARHSNDVHKVSISCIKFGGRAVAASRFSGLLSKSNASKGQFLAGAVVRARHSD